MAEVCIERNRRGLFSLFPQKAYRRTLPESWSDMSAADVWAVAEMLVFDADRLDILRYVLKLPAPVFDMIDPGQAYDLLTVLDFAHLDALATAPLANHVPVIDSDRFSALYLPADRFTNVTAMEYALLEDTYKKFNNSGDIADLDALLILCLRPAGDSVDYHSDKRCTLISTAQAREWLPEVQGLPLWQKTVLLQMIEANRNFVFQAYKDWLFTPSGPEEDSAGDGAINFGWWGALLTVAEDGAFGPLDKVYQTDIHTVCMYLVQKVSEMRRIQRQRDHQLAQMHT